MTLYVFKYKTLNAWLVLYLLIGPFPEASRKEDDRYGGLQVHTDGLDVDEELPTLTGLN